VEQVAFPQSFVLVTVVCVTVPLALSSMVLVTVTSHLLIS
jgi:hypothetical protein